MNKYFNKMGDGYVSEWKFKGLSNEVIKPAITTGTYFGTKERVNFNGIYLKQDKITYTNGTIVNIYIAYECSLNTNDFSFAPENCLFGAVKLTINADIDKYKHSVYGFGFDARGSFLFPNGAFGQNVITFGVDMGLSAHDNNKKKDVLILGDGITQEIYDTKLTAEKMYSITFTARKKMFCLSLHYNGANNYLFANGTEIIKFKAKDSEIVANPLCLGNISEDFTEPNMKETVLYGYVYDFCVDYNAIAVDYVLDIQKYLMETNNIK